MCHGHPHYHGCQHTSVKWLYCPEASFDLETGYETACSNPIYSAPQPSNADCPLQHCSYKRGSWTCCQCGHNTNSQGWCSGQSYDPHLVGPWTPIGLEEATWQSCGHGFCGQCTRNISSEGSTPDVAYAAEHRKGKRSRRTQQYEYATIDSIQESPSSTSFSHSSGYDMNADYNVKSKTSGGKKKPQRHSRRH